MARRKASPSDLAEIAAGKGSARDKREAGAGRYKGRKTRPAHRPKQPR